VTQNYFKVQGLANYPAASYSWMKRWVRCAWPRTENGRGPSKQSPPYVCRIPENRLK